MVNGPNATPLACAGVGLDALLVGSASDRRKVWLEDAQTAGRLELVWPVGFTVRFGQGAAFDVLNADGKIAVVGGSHVSGACVGGDAYWLDNIPQQPIAVVAGGGVVVVQRWVGEGRFF